MHEFALAEDIIETICQQVVNDMAQVSMIHLEVGVYAGVVSESLELGLQVIAKEKGGKDVQIKIKQIPAEAMCECGHHYKFRDIFQSCPQCQSLNRTVISGTDVMIDSVDLIENGDTMVLEDSCNEEE